MKDSKIIKIHGPEPDAAKGNVVLIHGFMGDEVKTWTAGNGAFWPGWINENTGV